MNLFNLYEICFSKTKFNQKQFSSPILCDESENRQKKIIQNHLQLNNSKVSSIPDRLSSKNLILSQ